MRAAVICAVVLLVGFIVLGIASGFAAVWTEDDRWGGTAGVCVAGVLVSGLAVAVLAIEQQERDQ